MAKWKTFCYGGMAVSEDALKEIKETGHGCKTCKYGQKWLTEEPCSSCDIRLGNNKWEPEEGEKDEDE